MRAQRIPGRTAGMADREVNTSVGGSKGIAHSRRSTLTRGHRRIQPTTAMRTSAQRRRNWLHPRSLLRRRIACHRRSSLTDAAVGREP
jgi:hypothetical protein